MAMIRIACKFEFTEAGCQKNNCMFAHSNSVTKTCSYIAGNSECKHKACGRPNCWFGHAKITKLVNDKKVNHELLKLFYVSCERHDIYDLRSFEEKKNFAIFAFANKMARFAVISEFGLDLDAICRTVLVNDGSGRWSEEHSFSKKYYEIFKEHGSDLDSFSKSYFATFDETVKKIEDEIRRGIILYPPSNRSFF